MSADYVVKSFKNKEEAEKLLVDSRNRIDEIDNELFDLISQRTSFAKDIALSKDYLGMTIFDKGREDQVHKKIEKISVEKGLDVDICNQIVNMLTILSKNEQKEILRRNDDGKY